MLARWALVAAFVFATPTAHAYEFWLRAQTIGQAYELRQYRLVGGDLFLGRRRITETLALRIDDVGDLAKARRISHLPERGLRISLQTYLRVDHDFGTYTNRPMTLPGPVIRDALDVIPELGEQVAALDLMYGYVQLDGLADDRLSVQIGRILADDGWGTTAFDGAATRVRAAPSVEVSASAGLRVRAASPLGTAMYELDGTSGAGCMEYVEGPTPGTGAWKLIDRNRDVTNSKLSSDYEYCPQRDVSQPTVGFSIAMPRTHGFTAEVGYRRTWSETVGLIGPVDRLQYPDRGLYPNDYGQAPATGVNEERLYARVHGRILVDDDVVLEPYADARFSILHALFDRADAGLRIQKGDHVLEPTVEYFYPTFDGDSIFNAFSIEPTTDVRLGYTYGQRGPWRGVADAWLRHYGHEDGQPSLAGGFDAGVERTLGVWRGRADALWDDGWGGRRVGGSAEAAWKRTPDNWLRGRVVVLGVREDDTSLARRYVTSSTVLSTTFRVADSVAVHVIAEGDYDAIHAFQTRVIGVLDLAFLPEP